MKIKPTVIIVILTALLICAIAWALNERLNKSTAEKDLDNNKVLADPTAPEVGMFKDSLGQNHSVFKTTENKVNGKPVLVPKGIIDTISKMSNIKPSEITNWQQVATTTKAELLKAQRAVDSLQRVTYYYKDQYLKLAYRPGNPADTTDKGTFDFQYDAQLTTTEYKRGGKLLGVQLFAPDYYTDVYSSDPRTTINGLRSFRVQQSPKTLGLRIQAITRYRFDIKGIEIGLGAQFDAGRVSIIGDSYYNPTSSQVNHEVGARYSIFK